MPIVIESLFFEKLMQLLLALVKLMIHIVNGLAQEAIEGISALLGILIVILDLRNILINFIKVLYSLPSLSR